MKRILTILALSLMCLTSNAQLVWKISGNGIQNPSYILGTHHGCPFNYCDSIPGLMKAFDKVDNIIGEINMIEFSEMSPERMQKMQAMTIMVTVQNKEMMEVIPEIATMTTIDKYMQTLGQRKGKTIGELETADYQMELLYGHSLAEQADALLEMIDHGDSKGLLQQLTNAYKSQNLDTLWKVFQEQMTGYEYDAIIKVRNLNWEKQMRELLPKQSTLFVVGAGHLPGESGMINLLREAGYKVKPVKK